jgi:hypothetical protein
LFLRAQDCPAPLPVARVEEETGDPMPNKNPATFDASMDGKSIVEPVREGDDGPRTLVSLVDFPTPRRQVLDFSHPLLPRDPAFQDGVQVAGADDLLRSGVEDGRVEEEWLSL